MGRGRRGPPSEAEKAAQMRAKMIDAIIMQQHDKIVCANIAIPLWKQFNKYDSFDHWLSLYGLSANQVPASLEGTVMTLENWRKLLSSMASIKLGHLQNPYICCPLYCPCCWLPVFCVCMCFKDQFKKGEPKNIIGALAWRLNKEYADKGLSFACVAYSPSENSSDGPFKVVIPLSGDASKIPSHVILQVRNIALVKSIEDSHPLEGFLPGTGTGTVEMPPVVAITIEATSRGASARVKPDTLIGIVEVLKQQLSVQGNVVEVVNQSCNVLNIPSGDGDLQQRADACYDAIFK